MSKNHKLIKILGLASLVTMSSQLSAGEATGTIKFGTIKDVSVSQIAALHFGDNYLLASGLSCTVTYIGKTDTKKAAENAVVARAGTACGISPTADSMVGGRFLIEGASAQAIKVKVTGATQNDLLFEPAGNVVPGDQLVDAKDNIIGADIKSIIDGSQVVTKLSVGEDAFGNANGKGFASVYVGGKLTAQADLANTQTIAVTYKVEVIY